MDSLNTISNAPVGKPEDDTTDIDELYHTQGAAREQLILDTYHIIFLLQRRLNADLARMIISLTDIYETYRQKRQLMHMSIMQLNCPAPCFVGDAIRTRSRLKRPVRRVIFRFESHDQGWASNRNGGSWTWFTVGVVPDPVFQQFEEINESTEPLLSFTHPDFRNNPAWAEHRGNTLRSRGRLRPPPPPRPAHDEPSRDDSMPEYSRHHGINRSIERELLVFRNSIACRDWELNTVVWSHDDIDTEKADWVRSLQVGDHIVVRAWAQFPGWTNYVRAVSVTICNAVWA